MKQNTEKDNRQGVEHEDNTNGRSVADSSAGASEKAPVPAKGIGCRRLLKHRKLWFAVGVLVVASVVTGVCISGDGGRDNGGKDSISQLRKDSELLKKERDKAALCDSLRRDSIERRQFTSPDLVFFDLHGPVKSVQLDYEVSHLFYGAPQLLEFNELGQWKCPDKTGRGQTVVYTRTAAGNLVRIGSPEEDFYSTSGNVAAQAFSYSYKWHGGRLAEMSPNTVFSYDDSGNLVREVARARDSEEKSVTTYSEYEYDDMGNWVKRHWRSSYTADSYSDAEEESGYETRVITYYPAKPAK